MKNLPETLPSSASILKCANLSVGYESSGIVLSDVNLEILPGSITSIVGPNGCGKSTLLKTLARQQKPVSGQVFHRDTDIWSISAREFSQHLSYVPQFIGGNINLTVEELVALGRNPHQKWWSWNVTGDDITAMEEAFQLAQVEKLKNRYFSTLSGGERQRSLIAAALAQKAEVILLDEPISNLDFKHQLSVISLLEELKGKNIAVVVILHDLNVIDRISDQVVLIESLDGESNRISVKGEPDLVLTKERLKAIFEVEVEVVTTADSGPEQRKLYNLFLPGSEIPGGN